MTQYCKVGFHAGVDGNHKGIGIYMRQLDKAGIPFCLKAVDNVPLVVEAAELALSSGLAHNILLSFSRPGGASDNKPDFNRSALEAAEDLWQRVNRALSQAAMLERFKDIIWIEPTDEIDDCAHSEIVGWFCYHLGRIANDRGYKVALAGHSICRPKLESWRSPGFQAFLRDCAHKPDRLAVSLHEGKLGDVDAPSETFYPHAIGRFTWLYDASDELNIGRPTTFISKWSWSDDEMPGVELAMQDVHWLSELVAKYPTLRGVFLWSLAHNDKTGGLPDKLRRLIAPVTEYALQARFPDPVVSASSGMASRQARPLTSMQAAEELTLEIAEPNASEGDNAGPPSWARDRGKPRVQYARVYVLLPPKAHRGWAVAVTEVTWEKFGFIVGKNPDDAGIGDLDEKKVIAVNPSEWGPGGDGRGLEGFFANYYPDVAYHVVEAKSPAHLKRLLSSIGPDDKIKSSR